MCAIDVGMLCIAFSLAIGGHSTYGADCARNVVAPDLRFSELGGIKNYRIKAYLSVAEALQETGRDNSIRMLTKLAESDDTADNHKLIILCRMLFVSRKQKEFRRPLLGAPVFFGDTTAADWPAEPIEIVDGVPFIIVRSYVLGGVPESGKEYLEYCVNNCDWSTQKYCKKTDKEIEASLVKLYNSKKWKKQLTDDEKNAFLLQTK